MSFVMHFDPPADVVAAAKQCELDVFLNTYGNSPDEWADEYGPYDASSVFLAVTDEQGDAVAACRFILPSPAGLKTVVDAGRAPWQVDGERSARAAGIELDQTWDVATIAVRKKAAPGGLLATAMYRGLYLATRANAARWIVMIMDGRARRLLNICGLQTSPLPGTSAGAYLGSPNSVPLWAEVAPMVDRQRRENPESYRLVTMGGGLADVAVPDSTAFVVNRDRTRPAPVAPALA